MNLVENAMEITGSHATGNTEETIVRGKRTAMVMIATDLTNIHGIIRSKRIDLLTIFKTPKPWIKAL
jgi:hypothetical protein